MVDAVATRSAEFHHRINVRWSDCDPAKIAFTGRIPYFALEAIDAWWAASIDDDWYRMNVDKDIGTPFVHMSIDLKVPVTPRHALLCDVKLLAMGDSSVTLFVTGRQDGSVCFEGKFVEVFVVASEHRKIPIPAKIREKLHEMLPP